jgi:Xaa-Pro aminopeptidase
MRDRLERIREAIAEERLDALYVSGAIDDVYGRHSQNRRYVSGFTGSAGAALVTRDRAIMAVDFRYTEQAERECGPRGFTVWKTEGRPDKWFPKLMKEADLPGRRIGISAADMTLASLGRLQRAVGEMAWGLRPELGPASPIVEKLRRRKDAEELALLQEAIDIGDRAFERVEAELAAGMTETAVAARVEEVVKGLGGSGVSFDTIVAGGAWAAQPHATPRDEAIRAGEPVVIDMGAIRGGYCSDLTRTTVLGSFSPEIRAIYEVVFAAQQRAIEKVEPGMTAADAHGLAHDVIKEAGYGEQFGHGLGHGVGLEVHEDPYLGPTSEDVLEEGMVFTIEPGIYVPGLGGVRIEDVVVLESGRARVLSKARKLTPGGM